MPFRRIECARHWRTLGGAIDGTIGGTFDGAFGTVTAMDLSDSEPSKRKVCRRPAAADDRTRLLGALAADTGICSRPAEPKADR